MSSTATTARGAVGMTATELGWKFIHWGLGLFIAGFIVGFIPILHYMVGAQEGDVGPPVPEEHHVVVGLSGGAG